MAYTKIINIQTSGHLKRAVHYAMNEVKTLEREFDALGAVNGYIQNDAKTDDKRYVSALNCNPETAGEEMIATKRRFNKEDKRQGYHIIQSFAPGEVTPELAHEIGVEYAKQWLSDFEVVIGTHLDKGHLHNHFIVNSVSCMDGHKFHISNGDFYDKLRGISDRLCVENGLSVIEHTDSRYMSYAEWLERHGGKMSLKQLAREDVAYCMSISDSLGELYVQLENRGYEVNINGAHPKIKMPELDNFMRIDTLMKCSVDDLRSMIVNKEFRPSADRPAPRPLPPRLYRVRPAAPHQRPRQLTRFQAMYVHYLYLLGKVKKYPTQTRIDVNEYRKFNVYKKQLQYMARTGVSSMNEAMARIFDIDSKIKKLDVERFKLLGAKKKHKALYEAAATAQRYAPIVDDLEPAYREKYDLALELLERRGYGGKLEQLEKSRVAVLDSIAQNKMEVGRLKQDKKMMEGILAGGRTIKTELKKENATHEKQKVERPRTKQKGKER